MSDTTPETRLSTCSLRGAKLVEPISAERCTELRELAMGWLHAKKPSTTLNMDRLAEGFLELLTALDRAETLHINAAKARDEVYTTFDLFRRDVRFSLLNPGNAVTEEEVVKAVKEMREEVRQSRETIQLATQASRTLYRLFGCDEPKAEKDEAGYVPIFGGKDEPPFKVGDLVTTDFLRSNLSLIRAHGGISGSFFDADAEAGRLRRVASVHRSSTLEGGWAVRADAGDGVIDIPPHTQQYGIESSWFTLAKEPESS